jgi:hypothetical protein
MDMKNTTTTTTTADNKKLELERLTPTPIRRPVDESPGLNIEAKIKIFDPESGQVLIEGRA